MVDKTAGSGPLKDLEQWEDDLLRRYPDPADRAKQSPGTGEASGTGSAKAKEAFRDYRAEAKPEVKEFYRLNHRYQTVDFVKAKRADYLRLNRRKMGLWDGLEFLNTLVDSSDPDTSLAQIEHLLQTAEAIRRDGHPRWFILTGLIHDFGKVLCLFGEPQWAVVGDTFPVGCAYSDKIVFSEFLADNPDSQVSEYQTPCGIYAEHCGLDNVLLSWGHDEYIYHVVKDYLPPEALYMIRYHSFYAWHREHAYGYLCDDHDRAMLHHVQAFNPYDLYSKSPQPPDWNESRPYYSELINKYFPAELSF
jgi:inositol oxygenase